MHGYRRLVLLLLTSLGLLVACDALRYFGPTDAESEAMELRRSKMDLAGKERTIAVYPVRRRDGVDVDGGRELAVLIGEREFGVTRALAEGPWFELQPSMNEQSALWEAARKFRTYARAHPLPEDYALYADFVLNEEQGRVFAVHFIVCDREGEWVRVEFMNSHHDEFERIAPQTRKDCARMVIDRLED